MMDEVVQLLLGLTDKVYHFEAPENAVPPYIVWQEIGQGEILSGDDNQDAYAATGTIDIFSRNEKEPLVSAVYRALNGAYISFYKKSVQYEPDTRLIHTEYEFDVLGEDGGEWQA